MRNQAFILALILSGCSANPIKPEVRIPKFKVGDCIRSYGEFDHKILEVWEKDYKVLIYLKCDKEKPSRCSTSAYPIEITDDSSVKIDCP